MGITIPSSSPSDNPLAPILINPQWLPILIGLCVDNLLTRSYWEGDESGIDEAIDFADELIYLLSGSESEVSLLGLVASTWLLQSASGVFEAFDSARLLASFNPSGPDTHIPLGRSVGNATTLINNSSAGSTAVGYASGNDRWAGQSFILDDSGNLSQLSIRFSANTGSPTGTVIWQIHSDNAGNPGDMLDTGTFTPTPSAVNTINVTGGVFLSIGITYWLVLRCSTTQSATNAYNVTHTTSNTYSNGLEKRSDNGGSSWTTISSGTADMYASITVQTEATRDKLAQAMVLDTAGDLDTVQASLRKKGSPTGNLTIKLYSDSNGEPDDLLATSDTITVGSLGTSFSTQSFNFSTPYSLVADLVYWLVLESSHTPTISNYIEWQAQSTS